VIRHGAVAVQLTLAPDGVCEQAGIGLTTSGSRRIKAVQAEASLRASG